MSATWDSSPSKPRSRGARRPHRVAATTVFLLTLVAAPGPWPPTFAATPERVAVMWGAGNAAVLWLATTWDKP